MRRAWALGPVVALVGGLFVAAAPLAKQNGTKFKCTVHLVLQPAPGQLAPNAAASTGREVGNISCLKPFGHGVQVHSFTAKPNIPPTTGNVSVSFKDFFDTGTIHGKGRATYAFSSPTAATYRGTFSVDSGTGAFKNAKASGTLTCTSNDAGVHSTCTGTGTLTRT